MPDAYRPHQIAGDMRKGMIVLADDERPRIEISWERLRKPADGERLMRRRFGVRVEAAEKLRNPTASPMMLLRDADKERDRAIGYFPATRRVVEVLFLHGNSRENLTIRQETLSGLVDQPADRDQRWAFFDVSFIAPAGFLYAETKLNLGDMAVTLNRGTQEFNAPSVTIRQIYPTKLALARHPLEKWHEDHVRSLRHLYADQDAGWFRRGRPQMSAVSTARGEGFVTQAKLRPALRPFYWRTPRQMRFLTVHDQGTDRLHLLRATGNDPADTRLDSVTAGLQWAWKG